MSITSCFAALADYVSAAQLEIWIDSNQTLDIEELSELNGLYARRDSLAFYWPRSEERGTELQTRYSDRWVYRDRPERPDPFVTAWVRTFMQQCVDRGNPSPRIFLCMRDHNDCTQRFLDAAQHYKRDVAFITGEFGAGIHFTSSGYDQGLRDYRCPVCGCQIVGGEEITLYLD